MAKKRNGRQDAIRDIVRNKDVRTQRVLVDELRAMGFDCTQATVSRDIADMGLRKLPEGIYVLAEDLHLQRMVSELVTGVLRTDNLVMIKAQPGTASGIAAASIIEQFCGTGISISQRTAAYWAYPPPPKSAQT